MSQQDESNPEDPSASRSSSADNLTAVAPLQRRISPPNEILFLDNSQDARSIKSTIQRHTAYHAAAQRREARLQTSRERTPLNLEWQRRTSSETPVLTQGNASTSGLPASTTPEIVEPARHDPPYMDSEETSVRSDQRRYAIEAHETNTILPVESSEPPVSSAVMLNIGGDEIGRRVLDAYQLAIRAQSFPPQSTQHWEAREASLEQVDRVLGVLRQRLADEADSCSDQTVQAVLILFVYASRFQTQDEAMSHRTALERMISLRGGMTGFGNNPVLTQQLERFASGSDVGQILRITSERG